MELWTAAAAGVSILPVEAGRGAGPPGPHPGSRRGAAPAAAGERRPLTAFELDLQDPTGGKGRADLPAADKSHEWRDS